IIVRCYDVLPVLACIVYIIITVLILKRKSLVSSSTWRSDWKTLAQGLILLVVYGIASIINIILNEHYHAIVWDLPDAATQCLLFIYISLDVIAAIVIPLSIFLTVPSLRAAPREIVSRWRARQRRRTLS
ncbi:hypothetical protein PMAYCL1PPCAC_16069, partial [Pristionchus mayeri]